MAIETPIIGDRPHPVIIEGTFIEPPPHIVPNKPFLDSGNISNAWHNPELAELDEVRNITEQKNVEVPIWESSKAEIYFSNPNLERYVIWKYDPDEEGVRKFPSFDANDKLPHHFYKSSEEYEKAKRLYETGTYPDKLIDLNIFFTGLK